MRKRLLSLLLFVVAGLSAVQAYDFSAVVPSGQTLYYNIISDSTVEITSRNSSSPYYTGVRPVGTLVISDTVTYSGTTYSVTSIGEDAFAYCSGLTSVTIPNSVTSIGNYAFDDCRGLTSVTIPNSVTSIGEYAFNLVKNIIYNGTATGSPWRALSVNGYIEGDFVYANNTKTSLRAYIGTSTSVTIPNSVTSIGNYAFYFCSGLTSVTIPNSVTSIGDNAFTFCSGLTSVTIPNSVTSIGYDAFFHCSGLTSVTIPNSVTSIGYDAFNLVKNIIYNGTATGSPWGALSVNGYIEGDFVYANNTKTSLLAYIGTSTNITIPNSVTTIGRYAFYDCDGLTSVTIPNSVTSIGNDAFYDCDGLTSVTIGNSVTSIGNYAFLGCSRNAYINIKGTNPPSIENNTFSGYEDFYVPCQSVSSYQSALNWSNYSSHIYGKNFWEHSYNFVVNDSTLGSVSFTEIDCDSNVVVTVSENVGCRLIGWSDGGTGNPRTFHLTGDTMVTAILDYIRYSVIVQSNDTIMGTVIGGGEYKPNSSATVAAIPTNGYQFTNWSNSSTLNPYTFTVTKDTNLVAYFEEIVPDTTFVHDTTYVPVHDTTYITQIDTVTNTVYDTITNTVYDTITNTVYDTTYITQIDTVINTVHDTVTNTVYDTITNTVYDTITNTVYDTITNTVYDTTYVPIHDTTYITQIDTVTNTVYDTITNTIYDTITNTVYDTTIITQIDTITNTIYDTITNTVYDTITNTVYDTITNTVYDTITNTVYDTTYITQIDTVINTVHDTVTNTVYDTVTNTVYDTIDNFIYDTVYVTETDTLWLFDTIYLHDTIYIYDTIYIRDSTTGIEDVSVINAKIYSSRSRIVVEGADGNSVMLFDMQGRLLATKRDEYSVLEFEVPISGAYFVKIGNYKAKKVVVIK